MSVSPMLCTVSASSATLPLSATIPTPKQRGHAQCRQRQPDGRMPSWLDVKSGVGIERLVFVTVQVEDL
ncbi:MAG: hypothetical protein IPK19_22110 [Chloroflexi bacterium]|nr:hypothetical protein [Chloroflexota bacterium]